MKTSNLIALDTVLKSVSQPISTLTKITHSIKKLTTYAMLTISVAIAGVFSVGAQAQASSAPKCELNRTVRFSGTNWETNLVLIEIERFIIEKGYGCKTEVLPIETLPGLAALARGDLDIFPEIWINTTRGPWEKALATGNVKQLPVMYMGQEGWFIPRYTAERLPELKSVTDLAKFKDAFRDPEEPSKGRFYNCPAGWSCEIMNANLFKALNLGDTFTLYSPGSGAAKKAALTSAYKRKRNILFYYWSPSVLVGELDLVELEFPPYNAEDHACLSALNCQNPKAVAFAENPVFGGVNAQFAEQAPQLMAFLSSITIPVPALTEALAYMGETDSSVEEVGKWFMVNQQDIWTNWVPADVAERIKASL